MAAVTCRGDFVAEVNGSAEEVIMNPADVDSIIEQIQQLTRQLDTMPDIADAGMALSYLRHLRRRHAAAVPVG
jgi:hypothetical protein